ncbi:glycosyltransferase family protein [Algoriphagus sp. PAP.12]|uniref:glycosyltransferase family protein n=1 Tax=Algoriphagus sp. PAP.12 TaxID=2996678 RepID=UPI00227D3028|nr:glycosyltransferase family protein [Algoriphagus sp. PAP.12]
MKFLFLVQGEGRGHMTQAISFAKLVRTQGHTVCGVVLGKSKRRAIPDFFKREISAPIHWIPSPNFVCDKNEKRISLSKTITKNLIQTPKYLLSLWQIHQVVQNHQPDIIVNFYDQLGGLYNLIFRPKAEYWVIGHQYLVNHSEFLFPEGKSLEKSLFKLNTQITSLGAKTQLALSFERLKSEGKTQVVPPLLRPEINFLEPTSGDFLLTYMVNPGYAEDVIEYAKQVPDQGIKVYWDKKDAAETVQALPNLTFHQVNDKSFLQDMATCKSLVCTAGFESVCEAMYLGKQLMVIPVEGQYEQACNALEIQHRKIGITSSCFDFSLLENKAMEQTKTPQEFIQWQNSWGEILQNLLTKEQTSWETSSPALEIG